MKCSPGSQVIDIWDQQDVMKLKLFDEMRISGKSNFIRKTRNQEQNSEIAQYFDKPRRYWEARTGQHKGIIWSWSNELAEGYIPGNGKGWGFKNQEVIYGVKYFREINDDMDQKQAATIIWTPLLIQPVPNPTNCWHFVSTSPLSLSLD